MKRLILHWTAGTHTPNATDRAHYHFLIDGAGEVHRGDHHPEANEVIHHPNDISTYAAHTANANTGAIGVAVAAMAGAREAPFTAGHYPITSAQIKALTALSAQLCRAYNIPVTRTTVLTHAEVQPTLGIKQKNKWDITWLPGMKAPEAPVAVGDRLRGLIRAQMSTRTAKRATAPVTPRPTGFWARVRSFFT